MNNLTKNLVEINNIVKPFIVKIVKESYKDDKDILLKTAYTQNTYQIIFLSKKTGNCIATEIPLKQFIESCINKTIESKLNILIRKMITRFDDAHQDKIIWIY